MIATLDKPLTAEQRLIVQELCDTHGLDRSQISFDDAGTTPIFDYEAVCALSIKLTDIKSIDCEIKATNPNDHNRSVAVCTVILPDGKSRTIEDSAEINEVVNGRALVTRRDADGMAQNRAVRRGIRSVGINLYNAHKEYLIKGEPVAGSIDEDPRISQIKEIHTISDKLGYSRQEYEDLIASGYDGRTTTSDLNDIERQNFLRLLRSLERIKASREAQPIESKIAA